MNLKKIKELDLRKPDATALKAVGSRLGRWNHPYEWERSSRAGWVSITSSAMTTLTFTTGTMIRSWFQPAQPYVPPKVFPSDVVVEHRTVDEDFDITSFYWEQIKHPDWRRITRDDLYYSNQYREDLF